MKYTKLVFLAALLCASSFVAKSQNNKIIGIWWNEEKSSRIEVYEEKGKIYGKIVWIKVNTNPNGTAPRTDYLNPDEKLKTRPVIGVRILTDLVWDADDQEWTDGEIYDPKSGKTYSCYAELQKDGKLFLKGYVLGMTFIGRSTLWTRYN